MNFCTECGSSLKEEQLFCKDCGAKINKDLNTGKAEETSSFENFFHPSGKNTFETFPGSSSSQKTCIVLTDLKKFDGLLGSSFKSFKKSFATHFTGRSGTGWQYILLDISSNHLGEPTQGNWQSYVSFLKDAVEFHDKKTSRKMGAIFIFGDEEIIPMPMIDLPQHWFNQDPRFPYPDKDVDSDHPYSTLSQENPFDSFNNSEKWISVGRLPTGERDGVSIGKRYLEYSTSDYFPQKKRFGFGMSGQSWLGSCQDLSNGVELDTLLSSPENSLTDTPGLLPPDSQYLYFKLHGSMDTEKWLGDGGEGIYPETVAPSTFSNLQNPNLVATQACYGARFIGFNKEQSILISSLNSKTIGFCGSSRIAWGGVKSWSMTGGGPILSDLIAHDFLKKVKEGDSFGYSLMEAKRSLLNKEWITPHDALSIIEFNLFGDPTTTLPQLGHSSKTDSGSPLSKVKGDFSYLENSSQLNAFNPLRSVKMAMNEKWDLISKNLENKVKSESANFIDTQPIISFFQTTSSKEEFIQLNFASNANGIYLARSLYADDSANLIQETVTF